MLEAAGELDADELMEGYAAEGVSASGGSAEAHMLVGGIHCAACIWLIEKVTARMPGVESCRVNFSTRRLTVRWRPGKASLKEIIGKVASIGYAVMPYDAAGEARLVESENDIIIRTAIAGFGFLATMFLSEGLYGGYLWGMEA
ncbi:MAG: cation transporter, partial [Deltaproteobacteria bacterium]|nr:cation transporter [Deltaproteobacteria bacterium]